MKRLILTITLVLFALFADVQAQVVVRLPEGTLPAYVDPAKKDTVAIVKLGNVYCFNRKRFTSVRHEKEYWRMVNDVKKTLPIAKAARELLVQVYDTIQYIPKQRDQRKYFKQLEKELFREYKPQLKKLNYRQGKLLVRLIDRECNRTSYNLIREYLGRTRAFFWQSFGALFGVSLKGVWEPNGNDRDLENICIQVEHGMI